MPQDAFHIRRLAKELNSALVGGKINRISQVNKDELTFIIYTGKSTLKLILSTSASSARVCISKTEKEPAPQAPNFCMLLRKHLQNAEIVSVEQHEFERIIKITLHCTTDFSQSDRVLYCELMGKYSNLVLTENGVILGALKTTSLENNSHRTLFTGAKYLFPKPQEKISPFDRAGMRSIFENYPFTATEEEEKQAEIATALFEKVAGLALPTAREIVRRLSANGAENCVKADGAPVWEYVGEFCINEPCAPCVLSDKKGVKDFFAFPVENGEKTRFLYEAEDEYYTKKEGNKLFEERRKKLENTVRGFKKRQMKRLQENLDRVKDAEKADEYRKKGELLTANLYRVEKGMQSIELEDWYSPDGGRIKIELDSTLPPSKVAQRYFKTYNKYKRAKEILLPMIEKDEAEISYTDSILCAVLHAETQEDLKEIEEELVGMGLLRAPKEKVGGKKKEIPFREFEREGFKIYAGRNNVQNDRLLRFAAPDDIWLHTQKYHSSHVIIVTEGREVPEEVLAYAARLCVQYSDGKEGGKVPVDYCKRKNVKKPNGAKAGFVTYTHYKTVLV